MVEFGDDILLQCYRIPWLIWIQFLVLLLLTFVILLSYFGLFALDSSPNAQDFIFSSRLDLNSACSQRTQVSGGHDFQEDRTKSTANRARGVGSNSEREGSSAKDLARPPGSEHFIHPCRYFDLAKQAFLKCLGLGSRKPGARGQGHED